MVIRVYECEEAKGMNMETRNTRIDIMKGIAIYMVVVGHLLDSQGEILRVLITTCHMPVFFCISGILFSNSYHKYGNKERIL